MAKYLNGNVLVVIKEDGTKIRYVPDGQSPMPVAPESIDIKITNQCDMNCVMCHEMSAPDGAHADLHNPLLDSLPPYTELAIGGGNPLFHPDLVTFLERMKQHNVICNMTLHWKHFEQNFDLVRDLISEGLIHGIGVSVNEHMPCEVLYELEQLPTAVVHVIAGLVSEAVMRQLVGRNLNLLILGYKEFGRGKSFHRNTEIFVANQRYLYDNLRLLINEGFRAVAFDNLAIKQLDVRSVLSREEYKTFYMGNDGQFTMYVDLVRNEYAVSSTSPRHDIDSDDIQVLFGRVMKGLA